MALEHSNLDSAKQYARGSDASPEAVLRAVTENTPDWLFLLDENLHVRFMNRPFGPNRPEIVLGRAFLEFVPQELRANMEGIYRQALATGVPARLELRKPGPDGVPGNFEHRIMPVVESGVVRSLTVAVTDVTERAERKQLEREIIEIANREQQRIGSDLHDGLGQELTGIALMLKGVLTQLRKEGSAAHRDVEEVIGLVNNAIDSTRVLARGLSPVGSGRGDLGAAIQTLAARVSERSGVRVVSRLDCEEPLPLSETAAAHVYRIVQEALTNAMRHSGAREVSIHLETSDDELHLRVSDDGRGFEHWSRGTAAAAAVTSPAGSGDVPGGDLPADGPGGMGLKIMRYRAQMLGGDLVIETNGSGGTSVSCSCPLDWSAEAQRGDCE